MELTPKKTRIAIVSSSFPPNISGGISSAHYNLYRMFKKSGYDVICFTYNDHHADGKVEEGVARFGAPRICLNLLNLFYNIYSKFLFRVERCNVAYQFPYCLESAAGASKVGRALSRYKPDVMILPDNGTPALFIPEIDGCKTILISHHNYLRFVDKPLVGRFSATDARLAHWLECQSLRKVDAVVCPSQYMLELFLRTHGISAPVVVIPNVVDLELIDSIAPAALKSMIQLSETSPLVYIPSAASEIKGAQFVFEIIRRVASYYDKEIGFFLSGDISDVATNPEQTGLPSNARIYSPGRLGYHDNIAIIKACDFCVSPTLLESFGMALLEANFCALPVISFSTGGVTDIIVNDVNGFLVDYGDTESIVHFSLKLLHDNKLLERMKRESKTFVECRFSSDAILALYEKLICPAGPERVVSSASHQKGVH